MKNKALFGFLLLIAISISCFIGFYIGSKYTQKKLDDYFLQLYFSNAATELKSQVRVLALLQNNEIQKGEDLLEFLIDNNLAGLNVYGEITPAQRSEEIIAAIRKVKEYRNKYPGHKVDPVLAGSVQGALDLAE